MNNAVVFLHTCNKTYVLAIIIITLIIPMMIIIITSTAYELWWIYICKISCKDQFLNATESCNIFNWSRLRGSIFQRVDAAAEETLVSMLMLILGTNSVHGYRAGFPHTTNTHVCSLARTHTQSNTNMYTTYTGIMVYLCMHPFSLLCSTVVASTLDSKQYICVRRRATNTVYLGSTDEH